MIYLDNAATSGKKPPSVINAVNLALREYCANPGRGGYITSEKTASAVFGVREKVADFFGASGPEKVVFTQNCTMSLNFVIKGILKAGDRALVSSLEHNAIMRPLNAMHNDIDIARVSLDNDDETVRNFEKAIKPNTKLVVCTGASNVTGKILPFERIGKLCKQKEILFALDAAQCAGIVEINMKKCGIDFLCIAPHKGLYAPMGTGILICEKPIPKTIIEGGTGTSSMSLNQPGDPPERFESGTVNVPGICGIGAGIDFINSYGIDKIYRHEMVLCEMLYDGLRNIPEVWLYAPFSEKNGYAPVISFNVEGLPGESVADYLNKHDIAVRAGLHCAPYAHRSIGTQEIGTVRVAPSVYNTPEEIKQFLRVIRSIKFV